MTTKDTTARTFKMKFIRNRGGHFICVFERDELIMIYAADRE